MSDGSGTQANSVQPFPGAIQSTVVTDELNRILAMLRDACPKDALISFDFDGKLQVHIDVRKREEVTAVETVLPMIGLGIFENLNRGATPHHPYFHRVSAQINR